MQSTVCFTQVIHVSWQDRSLLPWVMQGLSHDIVFLFVKFCLFLNQVTIYYSCILLIIPRCWLKKDFIIIILIITYLLQTFNRQKTKTKKNKKKNTWFEKMEEALLWNFTTSHHTAHLKTLQWYKTIENNIEHYKTIHSISKQYKTLQNITEQCILQNNTKQYYYRILHNTLQ